MIGHPNNSASSKTPHLGLRPGPPEIMERAGRLFGGAELAAQFPRTRDVLSTVVDILGPPCPGRCDQCRQRCNIMSYRSD